MARSASGLARSRAHASCVPRTWRVRAVCSVEHLWMAQNVVLCRVMAACCASLGSGRRAAGGVRGRSVGAEPMKGGAAHGVDARGLVGERGLGDGLLTLHVYLPVSKNLWCVIYCTEASCVCADM